MESPREQTKHSCVILTGPSAVGKTEVAKALLQRRPHLVRFVTTTTRPQRQGETDGKDYHFVSEEEFKKSIDNNEFFEWDRHYGHYYGSSKLKFVEFLKQDHTGLLVLDPTGARTVKNLIPEVTSVFLMPGSLSELQRRLHAEDRVKDDVTGRLAMAETEISNAHTFDHRITNHDGRLEETINNIVQTLNL